MTEFRPEIAVVGLVVVALAIVIGIARLRGWRPEWWERFVSPGRARGSVGAGTDASGAGASRGAHRGSPGTSSSSRRGRGGADAGRSPTRPGGTGSGRQAVIDLDDLPMFNPRERPRAASLDREFDMGDLGAIENESGGTDRPDARVRGAASDAPDRGPSRPGPGPPPREEREAAAPLRRGAGRGSRTETPAAGSGPERAEHELLVVLTIVAADERELAGALIRDALAAFDLQPDAQGMFHHYGNQGNRRGMERDPVFSVANVLDPGVFDVDAMDELSTPGLFLFMRRPGPLPASVAFDLMLDVGTRLSRALQATLCDDQRCRLTVQATQALRERVVHFALRNERGAPDAG